MTISDEVAICAECAQYALCRKFGDTWLCQSHYELAQDASADESGYRGDDMELVFFDVCDGCGTEAEPEELTEAATGAYCAECYDGYLESVADDYADVSDNAAT